MLLLVQAVRRSGCSQCFLSADLPPSFLSGQSFSRPSSEKLLPDLRPNEQHVYTLVLDLNDTLVHSDWKVGDTGGWPQSLQQAAACHVHPGSLPLFSHVLHQLVLEVPLLHTSYLFMKD